MRLIDADKLKKDVLDLQDCYNGFSDTYDKACIIGVIDEQPSAQPEPHWIPCSERLPEIDMSYPHYVCYLVQYDSGNMDVASWSNVNLFWTDHVTEPYWNCVEFAEVVAWMPLPTPYQEDADA